MKVIIQKVLKSSISVGSELVSSIGPGLLILVGISSQDKITDIEYMTRKILNVRIFDNEKGKKWSRSVVDCKLEILCVSQFTLYHSLKGNKLDFHHAMKTEEAKEFYQKFIDTLREQYNAEAVKDGVFGAMMQVDITNDGPVTIELTSPSEKG